MHEPIISLRRFEWACLLAIAAVSGTLRTSDIAAQQSAPGPTTAPGPITAPGPTTAPATSTVPGAAASP